MRVLRLSPVTAYELAFGVMNVPRPGEAMEKISRFIDGGLDVADLNREDSVLRRPSLFASSRP